MPKKHTIFWRNLAQVKCWNFLVAIVWHTTHRVTVQNSRSTEMHEAPCGPLIKVSVVDQECCKGYGFRDVMCLAILLKNDLLLLGTGQVLPICNLCVLSWIRWMVWCLDSSSLN